MKKFTVLTSLLALTACGGGSGGGSAPTPVNLNPSLAHGLDEMTFYTSDEETMKFNVDANGSIVSLTTEDDEGNKIVFAHTTGNRFQVTNKYFYNLRSIQEDAVGDYLADNGIYGPVAEHVISDTELSQEQIREQLIAKTIELFRKNNIDADASIIRAAYESLGDLNYHSGHADSVVMDVNSVGKDLQLAYSDFGSIIQTVSGSEDNERFDNEQEPYLYVGEYEPNRTTKPSENMTFNGAAVATIQYFNEAGNIDSDKMLSRTNDATLKLLDGEEILTMNFSKADNPWYDVEINVSTRDIDIRGTDARINETYRKKEGMTSYHNGTTTSYYTNDEHVVQEATAISSFGVWNNITTEGVEVNSVFGGKAQ